MTLRQLNSLDNTARTGSTALPERIATSVEGPRLSTRLPA